VKTLRFCKEVNIDVKAIVVNMSYVLCPHCNNKIMLWGSAGIDDAIRSMYSVIELPFEPKVSEALEKGDFLIARRCEYISKCFEELLGKIL